MLNNISILSEKLNSVFVEEGENRRLGATTFIRGFVDS